MKVYLINYTNSEGFYPNGRETKPIFGTNPDNVIASAYQEYAREVHEGKIDNMLDSPRDTALPYEAFAKIMKEGFAGDGNYVYVNFVNRHIQFEPFALDPLEESEGEK